MTIGNLDEYGLKTHQRKKEVRKEKGLDLNVMNHYSLNEQNCKNLGGESSRHLSPLALGAF